MRGAAASWGSEVRKWLATARISWSAQMAYKLNFVLLVIGPALVFYFIKLNLWRSIYASNDPGMSIQGYDLAGMLRYQAWVMIVAFLGQSFASINIAEDIRMGRISSYLVYPFDFWRFHAASFLSFQVSQLGVTAVTLAVLRGLDLIALPDVTTLLVGVAYCSLVGAFWFGICFVLGLASFWLEETWVLRVMFQIISQFLSGAIVPLEIFPATFAKALAYSPFPYMTYVPVRIFMGEYDGSVAFAALVLSGWLGLLAVFAAWMWRRGLRLYTAAGM